MFSKRVLASWLMAAFLVGCGKNNSANSLPAFTNDGQQITGGTSVDGNDPIARATVAIYLNLQDAEGNPSIKNICTGTLVDSLHVITAAHCFVEVAAAFKTTVDSVRQAAVVGFGTPVASSPTSAGVVFRKMSVATVHPGYVSGAVSRATTVPMYDAAVIRLDSPAPQGTVPARLGTGQIITTGMTITLAGFGLTDGSAQTYATQLNKVNVVVDNPAITITQFTYKVIDGRSSCSGDSGGPAYLVSGSGQLTVVGITSWGDRTCQQVGAYTSVPYMADWINSTIRSQP